MSDDHNRGAYTPQSDAPLAFDARHARGPGERPMPLTLIISGVVLIVLVIAGILFVLRGSSGEPAAPQAEQSIDAMKTAPPANAVPDAKPVDQQGLQIGYTEGQPLPEQTPASTSGQPNFTARPEAPGARPPAGAPPAAPPTTVVNAPLPPQSPPVTAPAAKAQLTPPPKAVTAEPKAAAPKTVEAKPAAPKPAAAKPASGGPAVQIGAFSSAALAEQSWNGVANRIPGRIAGKTLHVEKADVDGKTYHRALIGGFTSRADADSFCAALKEQGGACTVRN